MTAAKTATGREPNWTTSGGEYVPAGYQARGPVWPANRLLHMLMTLFLIDIFYPVNCERLRGTVSRLDRRNLPKSWQKKHGNSGASFGHASSDRHALIWMEEHGETMVGYAFTFVLREARVGDDVTLLVRRNSGAVRRVRNHSRPRKWWQF